MARKTKTKAKRKATPKRNLKGRFVKRGGK